MLQDSIGSRLVGIVVMLAYYIVLEALGGRTLGKLITGTKVLAEDGGKASLWRVLGRTFSRFVPFEPFSFFGPAPGGWHDRWSGTRVVRLRPGRGPRKQEERALS